MCQDISPFMKRRSAGHIASPADLRFGSFGSETMIAGAAAMKRILELAGEAARNLSASVLLLGESGTGKGMLAEEIHRASPRSRGPWVPVDCGAISPTLIESEFFGHERGAFTGAFARKTGVFEEAHRGTIFLDEVGELAIDLQSKLLRVLDTHTVRRVGSSREIRVDVRVISATNRDLESSVRQGRFREDLYYRLKVIEIVLPPLRERLEDILPLARTFLARFAREQGKEVQGLTAEAETILYNHRWPGNIRELRNAIEAAVAIERGSLISYESLPESIRRPRPSWEPPAHSGRIRLTDEDVRKIMSALERNRGNKTRAAREMGLTRGQLDYRLKLIRRSGRPVSET